MGAITYDGNEVVLDDNSDETAFYYGNGPGIDNKPWYTNGSSVVELVANW
ncbi:MAG: hypothetical protein FWF13_02750 [Acidobacteria bacterium]|nr:hypothetical protein [Acidobacteriota bacterium]